MAKSLLFVCLAPSIALGTSTALAEEPRGAAPDAATAGAQVAPAPQACGCDGLALEAFVDANASVHYDFAGREMGRGAHPAFDTPNGFALHWAGVDASYSPGPVGGKLSLRLGPATITSAAPGMPAGLGVVREAFASWRPGGRDGKLTLDLGKFGAPYGVESGDSQRSVNYTRGVVATLAQPGFFTGLRLDYAMTDALDVKLIVANGWNQLVDVNHGKSVGLQLNAAPDETARLSLGYMVGPEQADSVATTSRGVTRVASVRGANQRLRHFFDVVLDLRPTPRLEAQLNADVGTESMPHGRATWYGASATVRYGFTDELASALRGEYLRDTTGLMTATSGATALATGTLTLDYRPSPHLLLKLDQRVDYALEGDALFKGSAGAPSNAQITTILGVVVTTR